MSTPDPGWYRDPSDPTSTRWWDGTRWTEHAQATAPADPPVAVETRRARPSAPKRRGVPAPFLLAVGAVAILVGVLIGNLAINSAIGSCGTVFAPSSPIAGDVVANLEASLACSDARSGRPVLVVGLIAFGIICFLIGALRSRRTEGS